VLDRQGGGIATFATEELIFVFHVVRAFAQAGSIVVDVMAIDGPPDFAELRFDRLAVGGPSPWPHLRRFRLAPNGAVEARTIGTARFDFPAVNEALPAAMPHRFVYGVGPKPTTPRAFANALYKLDVADGSHRIWSADGHYLSEAVFVPRGAGVAEDNGVLVTVALIAPEARSALLVIDAATLAEIGRVMLPIHLPFGFHGRFFPRPR